MNRFFRQIAGVLLLAIVGGGVVCAGQTVMHHEPITVRVLDGRGGMPLARVHLTLIAGYDEHDLHQGLWQEEAVTDGAGSVLVPNSLVSFPFLQVVVAGHRMCIGDVSATRFSMDQIRFAGLNSANLCGVFTVENLSGVFVIFAKAKGSDRRAVKGAVLRAAGTSPVLADPVAPPQSLDPVSASILALGTSAPVQPDSSKVTAAGLFLDEASAESLADRPEADYWSEWMCQRWSAQ